MIHFFSPKPAARSFRAARNIPAFPLHLVRLGSDNIGDLNKLRQGMFVHRRRLRPRPITVLMPCPASIIAEALTPGPQFQALDATACVWTTTRPSIE